MAATDTQIRNILTTVRRIAIVGASANQDRPSYGVLRFLVEFVREPDRQLIAFAQATGLHMGQWLCVPMIVGGAALIARAIMHSARPLPQLVP